MLVALTCFLSGCGTDGSSTTASPVSAGAVVVVDTPIPTPTPTPSPTPTAPTPTAVPAPAPTAAPAPVPIAADGKFINPLSVIPTLSILDTVILPGERVAKVRVRLSEPARRPLAFDWQTRNGTGTYAPAYYDVQSGSIIFQPGDIEQVIEIRTKKDFGIGNTAQVLIAWTRNNPAVPVNVTGTIREAVARESVAYVPEPSFPVPALSANRKLIFESNLLEPVTPTGGVGKWRSRFGWGRVQVNNKELAPYTDASTDAGVNPHPVIGGKRVLRAEHVATTDNGTSYGFSASMMNSYGNFSFQYGYAELRVKIDRAQGTVPAFWLLPNSGKWPPEVDIFESGYGDEERLLSTILWPGEAGSRAESVFTTAKINDGQWHTIGLDWTQDWQVTLVDGQIVARRPNIFNEPMYVLLNVAVGGLAPAPANPGTNWHSDMTVDYFKVWQ